MLVNSLIRSKNILFKIRDDFRISEIFSMYPVYPTSLNFKEEILDSLYIKISFINGLHFIMLHMYMYSIITIRIFQTRCGKCIQFCNQREKVLIKNLYKLDLNYETFYFHKYICIYVWDFHINWYKKLPHLNRTQPRFKDTHKPVLELV